MKTKNTQLDHVIIKDFLELTKETYPFGHENELINVLQLPLTKDSFGNYFLQIGEPTVMFTSHLDTVSFKTKVNQIIDHDVIKTDGYTILGADDKAGVSLMIYMIKNQVQGLYYFFIGEECGRKGSTWLSENFQINANLNKITKVVSFDRKGTNSVITHQMGQRCASDDFANCLATELNNLEPTFNYRKDSNGVYTDSYSFINSINECTNLSVGYYFQHTNQEYQSISHLIKLGKALCFVQWEKLPVKRMI